MAVEPGTRFAPDRRVLVCDEAGGMVMIIKSAIERAFGATVDDASELEDAEQRLADPGSVYELVFWGFATPPPEVEFPMIRAGSHAAVAVDLVRPFSVRQLITAISQRTGWPLVRRLYVSSPRDPG